MTRARLLGAAALLLVCAAGPGPPGTLDAFEDIAAWRASPSAGVRLDLSGAEGVRGRALRLDFDFQGRAGWAAVRRPVSIDLDENYEFDFSWRGQAPANDLEIKLIDASGENVWWSVRRGVAPPRDWQEIRLKKRHFSFAWGPAGGGEIHHVAFFEIAVTARAGGAGWIAIDDLRLTPLPPPGPPARPPSATASSSAAGFEPERAIDGNPATSWRSGGPGAAWLAIDFGEKREYGGMTIDWEADRFARLYEVEMSDDGKTWTSARAVEAGNGGRDDLFLPESESRYVRLKIPDPHGGRELGVREIMVRPLAWSTTPNAFFEAIAREAPRGAYPRSFSGEQSYWTVVGADGDTENALVGEDGAVEPFRGSFSVEPFLFFDGRLLAWSDVDIEQSLEDGDLPIPSVTWRRGALSLEITAYAAGPPEGPSLLVRYRIRNSERTPRRGKLFLAVRPFQVNPPTQFLNGPGGAVRIEKLQWDASAVLVDGARRIVPRVSPSGFGAAPFDGGPITDSLARGELPSEKSARDGFGYASGALAFDLALPAGGTDEVSIELPIHASGSGRSAAGPLTRREASQRFAGGLAASAREWREKLDRVGLKGPPAAARIFRTLRSNLAYALVERDGPALRPGTRAYARSWIRDGALISAALLRLGHPEPVRAYIEWFVKFQDPDGRVPCCVDRRGADAVPENDSHGELLFLIAEYWRFTRDANFLQSVFPHVVSTVAYIDSLRQKRRTEEYRALAKLPFFGLLPESISHEGYSARPVHSYWDDFWAHRGLKDAVDLAAAVGREDLRSRWLFIRDEFAADLFASLSRVISSRGIDFVPGSAELADFDPTSTTAALDPAGEMDRLPRRELLRTFERYFEEFQGRREGRSSWEVYTPYELRNIGAFVRLGWRDRAHQLLGFFFDGLRPEGWKQWAEVVGREPRKPRFIGDMPHAWVGSDFLRSALDLFAWERESDGALVLAAGIPVSWLRGGSPVGVRGLRTSHGLLDYTLHQEKRGLRVTIGSIPIPRGGIALRPPLEGTPSRVLVNGKPVPFSGEELVIRDAPAAVIFENPPAAHRP